MTLPKLEQTIDKIIVQTETDLLSNLKDSYKESVEILSNSESTLKQEYDKIINDGKKEADKLSRQIIGSSDLETRNKQILLVEESVKKVFDKAIEGIKNSSHNDQYSKLISTLLEESTKIIGSTNVVIFTNSKDKDIVQSILSNFSGAELSPESIDCLGGVQIKSKDGAMTFNNTIDARLERMKPLIRKEIASQFGIGN